MATITGVADWQEDPTVPSDNSHRLKPVTWAEYVAALEEEVVALTADSARPKVLLETCKTAWREAGVPEDRVSVVQTADTVAWNCDINGHLPCLDGHCQMCGKSIS